MGTYDFSRFSAPKQNFLTSYIQNQNVLKCMIDMGRSQQLFYKWMTKDADFANIVRLIREKAKEGTLYDDEDSIVARTKLHALFEFYKLMPMVLDNYRKIITYLNQADLDTMNLKTLASVIKSMEDVCRYTGLETPPSNTGKKQVDSIIENLNRKTQALVSNVKEPKRKGKHASSLKKASSFHGAGASAEEGGEGNQDPHD